MVLLSPLGYSPTGEVFNLSAEEVATAVASALRADKLLLLTEHNCRSPRDGKPLQQLTTREAGALLQEPESLMPEMIPHLRAAVVASQSGVQRAHLVNRHIDGAILLELFTRDGAGTLVSSAPFEEMRAASINDIGGMLDLIRPLEESGVLVPRSRENLEREITDYSVIERDGLIVGCGALHVFQEERMAELACLALHPDYRGERRGERLLSYLEVKAQRLQLERVFVLSTQTIHWFRERGYEPARIGDLPVKRQALYNYRRNSKILVKLLDKP